MSAENLGQCSRILGPWAYQFGFRNSRGLRCERDATVVVDGHNLCARCAGFQRRLPKLPCVANSVGVALTYDRVDRRNIRRFHLIEAAEDRAYADTFDAVALYGNGSVLCRESYRRLYHAVCRRHRAWKHLQVLLKRNRQRRVG